MARDMATNHASFRLSTVVRRGSCGPTRLLILISIQSLVLCFNRRCGEASSGTWSRNPGSLTLQSASKVQVSQPYRMEVTKDLNNLNLLAKLMALLRQILFHLAVAVIVEATPDAGFR